MYSDEDREKVKQLIRNIASEVKLERLGRPYSLLSPAPYHFQQYSKCDAFKAQVVEASGLEMEVLYEHYGMPRGIPQVIATLPGAFYGEKFVDFSIEIFGLKVDLAQPAEIDRLAERSIGDNFKYSNANPDSIPFGAGLFFGMIDSNTGESVINIAAWRWRIFMNESSLCLENNWHRNDLTGGGWIPYILGIVYDNPEKMVADAIRFAPAFRLCNLVEASLNERRGGDRRPKWKRECWSNDTLNRYATLVKKLATDWEWIKSTYEPYSPDSATWLDEIFTMPVFNSMLQVYPKLTRDLLMRIADDTLSARDREPIALACVHAAYELGIAEIYKQNGDSLPQAQTLREYYEKGLKPDS